MGSCGINPGSCGRSLHALPDPLAGDVHHGPAAFLGVKRGQVGQALEQVRGNRDLAATAGLVAWGLRPDADYRGILVEPQVAAAQGQRLGDPDPVRSMIRKAMRVG